MDSAKGERNFLVKGMMYVRYFKYLIRHKWYVFLECCKRGLIWQGLIHDLSKFLPDEFIPYARFFYGERDTAEKLRNKYGYYKPTETGNAPFEYAWFLHQKRNQHHWQYWVVPEMPEDKVKDIPDKYLDEMICDWIGAGRAQNRVFPTSVWFEKNRDKMKLSESTITRLLTRIEGI